jgi:ribosomal protein RSM22 (predicted rRNA methylase)
LHNDAKRLFRDTEEGAPEDAWEAAYNTKYKNKRQETYHSERDGTAFASVALPSHYSAIYTVLDHVKRRLEPGWTIQRVIDWGAGAGSGLW